MREGRKSAVFDALTRYQSKRDVTRTQNRSLYDNSMLIYRRTSILESSAQTLVNTVNCVGVMGKGIAKEFKSRFPEMYRPYKDICDKGLLEPGKLWLWQGPETWVLNFPTKIHWRNPSKLDWIEAGLKKFVKQYAVRGIQDISFPRLGCGNGGLDWADVRPMMEHYLEPLDIPIFIHDFSYEIGMPEHMEHLATQMMAEQLHNDSFDEFMESLRRVLEVSHGRLEELQAGKKFVATLASDGTLTLSGDRSDSVMIETEALRGIWLSLRNGIVTREKAGWADRDGADALLAILSVLPVARPVQIQRPASTESELAVELKPAAKRTFVAEQENDQTQFAWA